jgi:hypothetical protein
MPQIFHPAADTIARTVLVALLVGPAALLGFAWAFERSGYATGQDRVVEQPVPFSHQHHAGELRIDCRYCHVTVETSRFAGIPSTHVCMTCHSQVWTNAPMLAPVRQSLAEGRPLRWNRVHQLPGYVYFDHSIHVAKGVACASCHGPVHEMPLVRQVAPLTMGWCLDCHRNPGPRLSPPEALFDTRIAPGGDGLDQARAYLARYHVRTRGLTDCTVCHR